MAQFPSGTVSFLFTDIAGSTALWERDRTAMRGAVERRLELLDAAVVAHGACASRSSATPYRPPRAAVAEALEVAQSLAASRS